MLPIHLSSLTELNIAHNKIESLAFLWHNFPSTRTTNPPVKPHPLTHLYNCQDLRHLTLHPNPVTTQSQWAQIYRLKILDHLRVLYTLDVRSLYPMSEWPRLTRLIEQASSRWTKTIIPHREPIASQAHWNVARWWSTLWPVETSRYNKQGMVSVEYSLCWIKSNPHWAHPQTPHRTQSLQFWWIAHYSSLLKREIGAHTRKCNSLDGRRERL